MKRGDLCCLQLDPKKNHYIQHFLKNGKYASAKYHPDNPNSILESDLIWDAPAVLARAVMIVVQDKHVGMGGDEFVPVLVEGQFLIFREIELELIPDTHEET